jgi:hypothetical protein
VVEVNKDRGVIELQKARGNMDIYQRQVWNKRDSETTEQYGWMTTEKSREMVISTLARALREAGKGQVGEGIEVRCPWILGQLKNFVTKKNGRSEAAKGKHDDDVLMVSIGLQCIDQATTYSERIVERTLPRDLQRLYDARQAGQAMGTYS